VIIESFVNNIMCPFLMRHAFPSSPTGPIGPSALKVALAFAPRQLGRKAVFGASLRLSQKYNGCKRSERNGHFQTNKTSRFYFKSTVMIFF
jgi:hypothetical protein